MSVYVISISSQLVLYDLSFVCNPKNTVPAYVTELLLHCPIFIVLTPYGELKDSSSTNSGPSSIQNYLSPLLLDDPFFKY